MGPKAGLDILKKINPLSHAEVRTQDNPLFRLLQSQHEGGGGVKYIIKIKQSLEFVKYEEISAEIKLLKR